jgi:hypothetical protein
VVDDAVFVIDRGFWDAVDAVNRFDFNVQMSDFLKGKKQLSSKEADRFRYVATNRWIIESGR